MRLRTALLFLLLAGPTFAADEPGAITKVEELVALLRNPEKNIFTDREAQVVLLTPRLRELTQDAASRHALFQQRHSDEPVDPADNSMYLNSWDPPTRIVTGETREEAGSATVETKFEWGPDTNYPGETRRVVFYLKNVEGSWRIDEIYHDKSKFSEPENLTTLLSKLWRE